MSTRKSRIFTGSGALPFSVLACYLINRYLKLPDDPMLTAALNTAVGSGITWLAMCFHDLRMMLFSIIRSKLKLGDRRGE